MPDRREILRYLGVQGDAQPELELAVDRCAALLLKTARPRLVWRRFPLEADGGVTLSDFRLDGRDAAALLRGCNAVILFAATLGMEAEALQRRTQITDLSEAVILDACGSAAIETVCNNFCADLASALAPMYLTPRFSPGYGDLSLDYQRRFCLALDAHRRIGVTVTPAGERAAIARRILEAALRHGLPREDVLIDCLTLTVSAQQNQAAETLAAVRYVRETLGLHTVLGVSFRREGLC